MRRRKREAEDEGLFPEEPQSSRLMPVDVQQKEFRMSMRGYRESDVDEFLDEVTEELGRLHEESSQLREENRRLRERAGVRPTDSFAGTDEIAEAQRTADQLVARAREEAARIVSEAEERARLAGAGAAAGAAAGAGAGLSPFLSREREFLQGLATLIQGHAEYVKTAARAVRGRAAPAPPPATEAPAPVEAAPAEPEAVGGADVAEPEAADATDVADVADVAGAEVAGMGEAEERDTPAPEAGTPEPEPSVAPGGPEGLVPVPEPTGVGEVDLSPWRGEETASPRRDTRAEDTATWENPFEPSEDASAMDEPGAISSSIREEERPARSAEEERSLRELFWGED
ncbi:MAG: DivIVA domain-containing protein [Actinobacteria bacterium]|nr:DivIVA domain-containing protein [Actinomycetota bacterium]